MKGKQPLDQTNRIVANTINHTAKVLKNSKLEGSILEKLYEFSSSIPDFRRAEKGNIRHRLGDIIKLLILGRVSNCVSRAEIIEFGKHNLNSFRKLDILANGIPSEATLCRMKGGIHNQAMANQLQVFAETFREELLGMCCAKEIICIDGKSGVRHRFGKWTKPRYRIRSFIQHRHHAGNRGLLREEQ